MKLLRRGLLPSVQLLLRTLLLLLLLLPLLRAQLLHEQLLLQWGKVDGCGGDGGGLGVCGGGSQSLDGPGRFPLHPTPAPPA